MRIEWDNGKNHRNQIKHGLSFETASSVFDDMFGQSVLERVIDGEERWQTVGQIAEGVIVLVAHTYRIDHDEEIVRIISARKATKTERKSYEKGAN